MCGPINFPFRVDASLHGVGYFITLIITNDHSYSYVTTSIVARRITGVKRLNTNRCDQPSEHRSYTIVQLLISSLLSPFTSAKSSGCSLSYIFAPTINFLKMRSNIPLEPPCHECKKCTAPDTKTLEGHTIGFKIVWNSPVDGINFKAQTYTANQIAETFSRMTLEDFDWEIKRLALQRWNIIVPGLLEGPLLREAEFDLQPVYHVLDDFLFRRALRSNCGVEWADAQKAHCREVGWAEKEDNIRGPKHMIYIVRPSVRTPRTVQDCLDTLLHEMCHAIFSLACQCAICGCELNEMNGEGLTGHGPAWQIVAPAIEDCVNLWLKGFSDPFRLSYPAYDDAMTKRDVNVDLKHEAKIKAKMLGGLYCAINERETETARNKKIERERKRADKARNTAEGDRKEAEELENLACVNKWFK